MSGLHVGTSSSASSSDPALRALPESPGQAISRFRDDAVEIENCVDWTLDALGSGIFALIAFIILARIDVLMTVLAFAPLLSSVAIVQIAATESIATGEQVARLRAT
jgi:ABC-type multidrug transport system fused ATPase/permease subunit